MGIREEQAKYDPRLQYVRALVAPDAFGRRNGALSEHYREGQAALARNPTAEGFVPYLAGVAQSPNWGHAETLSANLSGALSNLSLAELAKLVNHLEARRLGQEKNSLVPVIVDTPAVAALPAPLLSAVSPGAGSRILNNHAVRFGRHVAGVAALGPDQGGLAAMGVLVIGLRNPVWTQENERFLRKAADYAGPGSRPNVPVSYILQGAGQWAGNERMAVEAFLEAQGPLLGLVSDQVVAVLPTDMRIDPEFYSKVKFQGNAERGRELILLEGPPRWLRRSRRVRTWPPVKRRTCYLQT